MGDVINASHEKCLIAAERIVAITYKLGSVFLGLHFHVRPTLAASGR